MGLSIGIKLILAFILGSFIGLEREIDSKKVIKSISEPIAILGVRSFSLITVLGALSGIVYKTNLAYSLLIGATFSLLLISFYLIESIYSRRIGITTELAMIFSFLIGLFVSLEMIPIQLIIAVTIVLTLVLSRKEYIKELTSDIRKREIDAFISFAIIAIVILPFLPNKGFTLLDFPNVKPILTSLSLNIHNFSKIEIINPFTLWLIVVLITGVDLCGYLLVRFIGQKKGWLIASFIGGFVSSTATTHLLANLSRKHKVVDHLVAAALIAYLGSFISFSLLIIPISRIYFEKLFPIFSTIIIVGTIIEFYLLRKKEKDGKDININKSTQQSTIFRIAPALKFAAFFLIVQIASKISLVYFGAQGFVVTSAIIALSGIHLVLLNTAVLVAGKTIDLRLAVLTFLLSNSVNLIGKATYSYMKGNRNFALKYAVSIFIIITASWLCLIFFH